MEKYVSVNDFEQAAKTVMTENASSYVNSGANHQLSLRENQEKFHLFKLNPRALVNVNTVSTTTKVMGREVSVPFGIAPTAMHCLVNPLGEKNTIRAANTANTLTCISTLATFSISEIANASPDAFRWFQLYVTKDRSITKQLIKQAEDSGYSAIVLTVDAPVLGKRELDNKIKFNLPAPYKLENLESISEKLKMDSSVGSGLLKLFISQIDQSLDWNSLAWLKEQTKLPIVLKGIQCWEDAVMAGIYLIFFILSQLWN